MDCERSVTEWIQDVQQGKSGDATQELFERFYGRLIGLARKRLGNLHAYEDEQDVAISAMKSFFLRAPEGKFPKLTDRNSLWSLLAAITLNKTASLQRRQFAELRDERRNVSLEAILQSGPSEELLDSVFQEGNSLLDKLGNELLKQVAQLRMEGYTNQEIAEKMGISLATVKRKLNIIRKYLESELGKTIEP
jgi:RNA polymerase sigma factor (sigma-70 family)